MTDQDVRALAVDAANRLYYRRGYQSVGMDDLRRESGLSLRRLYGLFPSKARIVLEVLDHRHEAWTTGLSARVDAADGGRDRLLAIYDYLADCFSDGTYRGCGFINAFAELGTVSPAVANRARQHKKSFQAYVSGLVADAGARPELAAQLSILAEGAQTTAAISGTPDAARQARGAAEILIDAAMPQYR